MTDNPMNSTVSYEILEAINLDRPDVLNKIVAEYRTTLNSTGSFDANVQNLALAEFLLSKNAAQFFSRLDKKSVSLLDTLRATSAPNDPLDALNALYLLHNMIFFRCLAQKHLAIDEEISRNFNLTLERPLQVDSKSIPIPSFPMLKIFLADLNAKFNSRDVLGLACAIPKLKQFRKIKDILEKELAKSPKELTHFVPLLCGAQFQNLSFYEQNLFAPLEIELIYRIFRTAIRLVLLEEKSFDKSLKKLSVLIETLESASVAPPSESKLLSESPEPHQSLEAKAKQRLLKHASSLLAFFTACGHFYFRKDIEAALTALSDKSLLKNGKFRTLFSLPAINLLASFHLSQSNPSTASLLLSSSLAARPRARDPPRLLELGPQNAAFSCALTSFNLANSLSSSGLFDQAITILNSLSSHLKTLPLYHYKLGTLQFRILQRDLDHSSVLGEEAYNSALSEDFAKTLQLKLKRQSCNSVNIVEDLARRDPGKWANVHAAIASFSTCETLLETRMGSAEKELQEVGLGKSLSELYLKKLEASAGPLLASTREHLAFLFLLAKEPHKALKTVERALQATPSPQLKSKMQVYAAAAQLQLGEAERALTLLETGEGSGGGKGGPVTPAFYPIGKVNSYSVSWARLVQYNRAVAAYSLREREARVRLLEEFFQEEEGKPKGGSGWSQKPNYHLHLAYCYHYREKPNLVRLAEILKSVDSQTGV